MPATTRLLAPRDLIVPLEIADGMNLRNGRYVVDFRVPDASALPTADPNMGLLYQRYLPAHDEADGGDYSRQTPAGVDFRALWLQAGNDTRRVVEAARQWHASGALAWFSEISGDLGVPEPLLKEAWKRRAAARAHGSASHILYLQAQSRLATGLANPSAVENSGVTVDHTYGFPILPAASLKGVARHYAAELVADGDLDAPAHALTCLQSQESADLLAWAAEEGPPRADQIEASSLSCTVGALISFVFGTSSGKAGEGAVVFHDAWPLEARGWFEIDVLTSHHMEYYGDIADVASDSDEPNPVQFLVVRPGLTFGIPINEATAARRLPEAVARAATRVAARWLLAALAEWGIGAKTGSGYGLLDSEPLVTGAIRRTATKGGVSGLRSTLLEAANPNLAFSFAAMPNDARERAIDGLSSMLSDKADPADIAGLQADLRRL